MNLAAFRVQFPEFAAAPDAMVQVFLDAAALQIDATVWLTLTDQGHGFLAAHKLALSPYGQAARLSPTRTAATRTTYYLHYEELRNCVTGGWARVC